MSEPLELVLEVVLCAEAHVDVEVVDAADEAVTLSDKVDSVVPLTGTLTYEVVL